jgi:phenylpyruvate tautomerase PptA (4-oxalocrotonate tautomerase family)
MPIIRIDLVAGRPPERTRDLIRRVTEAVVATLEVRPEHWAIGGVTMAELTARDKTRTHHDHL